MTDDEILEAQRWLASVEGVFCEPASAASVAGALKHPPEGALLVCVITGHGLKDPEIALEQAARVVACDPVLSRGRASGARRLMERRRRVTRPGLLRQPGTRLRRDGGGRCRSTWSWRWRRPVSSRSTPAEPACRRTGRNLCVRAFEDLHPADGIAFRIRSEIPLAAGLGSSGAAIVAALVAADHMFELALPREEILARAARIEGHPDNVAASLYGGFVICADGDATGVEPPAGLEAVAVIPGAAGVDRGRARRAAGRGAAGRRHVQRRARVAAVARAGALGSRADRARPRGPAAPAAAGTPLSALDGAAAPRPRAGRARRLDLRRRPDRAVLGVLRADRARWSSGCAPRPRAGPTCRRLNFVAMGADVVALLTVALLLPGALLCNRLGILVGRPHVLQHPHRLRDVSLRAVLRSPSGCSTRVPRAGSTQRGA